MSFLNIHAYCIEILEDRKYEGENKNLYVHLPKITALNILVHFVQSFSSFCFERVLDLRKSCKNSTEHSSIPLRLVSPLLTFYFTIVQLSKLKNWHWCITIKGQIYLDFTIFSINVLFLLQDPVQEPMLYLADVPPSLLWSVTASQSFLLSHEFGKEHQ